MRTKKIPIFFILLFTVINGYAQIKVNSSGNLLTSEHEIYLRDVSGSKYGIGYNAFGCSQMVLFSDQYIELRESDANTLCGKFDLNNRKSLFYGDIGFNTDHWTGGLKSDMINFNGYNMESLMTNSPWYGTIGTQTYYFGAGYISHMYSAIYDDWPSDGRLKENVRTISNPINIIKSLEEQSDKPVLYQNEPNPFDKDTEIRFYLPERINNAKLLIFNMQGNQLRSINITQKGNGFEIIHGSDLQPGMYMYTLIVDGREIDTKRMILTD